jgi:hypothetical protein
MDPTSGKPMAKSCIVVAGRPWRSGVLGFGVSVVAAVWLVGCGGGSAPGQASDSEHDRESSTELAAEVDELLAGGTTAEELAPALSHLTDEARAAESLAPFERSETLDEAALDLAERLGSGDLTGDEFFAEGSQAARDAGWAFGDVAVATTAPLSGEAPAELAALMEGDGTPSSSGAVLLAPARAPVYDAAAIAGATTSSGDGVLVRIYAGDTPTDSERGEYGEQLAAGFVAAREHRGFDAPTVGDPALAEVAEGLACIADGPVPGDAAVPAAEDYWVAAIPGHSPWLFDGLLEETENSSGIHTEGVEAVAVAVCPEPTEGGELLSAIAFGFALPDPSALAAWHQAAVDAAEDEAVDIRAAAGLDPLAHTAALDAYAERWALDVAEMRADGSGAYPPPPPVPAELEGLVFRMIETTTALRETGPNPALVAAEAIGDPLATGVGYAAVRIPGVTQIVIVIARPTAAGPVV